jgi:hypothetical protein
MYVYSKYELIDSKTQFLTQKDIPSMHTKIQLPSGKQITAHFLHPLPPQPKNKDTTQRDAELLRANQYWKVKDQELSLAILMMWPGQKLQGFS